MFQWLFCNLSAVQWDKNPEGTSANCNTMHASSLCLTHKKHSRRKIIASEIMTCTFLFMHLSLYPWPYSGN